MPSQVEIVNNALVKLGAGRITSIDDDSKQAEVARAIWAIRWTGLWNTGPLNPCCDTP